MNGMQRFLIVTNGSQIRTDRMEGREYLVAPMVMLTEGVYTGSKGGRPISVFYGREELSKLPMVWNHKPIVINHPMFNGAGISACDPDILSNRKVGLVMNASFDGRLKAEAWMETSRLSKIAPDVLSNIQSSIPTELSTGIFPDISDNGGEWNGKPYAGEAKNIRPDHIAILTDSIGACSLSDGAGLLVNEAVIFDSYRLGMDERKKLAVADFADDKGLSFPILNQPALDFARRLIRLSPDRPVVINRMKEIVKRKGLNTPEWLNDPIANEVSYEGRRCAIQEVLDKEYSTPDSPWLRLAYVEAVYNNFFIYELGNGSMFKQGYSIDANGVVSFTGTRQEVVEITEYRTVGGAFVGNSRYGFTNKKESPTMAKKDELVNGLIAGGVWKEEHRPVLNGFTEEHLTKIAVPAPVVNATPPPPAPTPTPAPTATPPATLNDYIANAPPEIRELLTNGLAAANAEKDQLVAFIIQKAPGIYTEASLKAKSVTDLRPLAAVANGGATPVVNYQGAQGGAALTPPAPTPAVTETPLVRPKMDYTKK